MNNIYAWPIFGALIISAAIGLSFAFESLWVGFFVALGVGLVFLAIMSLRISQKFNSKGTKKTVAWVLLGLSVLFVYNSVLEWNKSENQQETLSEIRRTIDGSIAQMEAEKVLIETLRHAFLNEDVETLETAFRSVTGDRLEEDGTLYAKDEKRNQDLNFSAEIAAPDSIIIRIVADIAKGEDDKYENVNGYIGKYQGMATLTTNGVRYVRQN